MTTILTRMLFAMAALMGVMGLYASSALASTSTAASPQALAAAAESTAPLPMGYCGPAFTSKASMISWYRANPSQRSKAETYVRSDAGYYHIRSDQSFLAWLSMPNVKFKRAPNGYVLIGNSRCDSAGNVIDYNDKLSVGGVPMLWWCNVATGTGYNCVPVTKYYCRNFVHGNMQFPAPTPAVKPAPKPTPPAKPAPPVKPAPKPTPKSTNIFGSKTAIVDGTRRAGIQFYLQISQGAKRYPSVPVTSGVAPKLLASVQAGKPARACEVNLAHSLDGWTLVTRCKNFVPTGAKYVVPVFINTKTTPVPAPKPAPVPPTPIAACITTAGVPMYNPLPNGISVVQGVCTTTQVTTTTTTTCGATQHVEKDSSGVDVCINNVNTNTNTNTNIVTTPITVIVTPPVIPFPTVVSFSPTCSANLTANKSNREVALQAGGTASNGSTPTGAGWTLTRNGVVVGTPSGLSTSFQFADQLTTYNWTAVVQWSAGSASCSGSIQTGAALLPLPRG